MARELRLPVANGPSKWDFMISLFQGTPVSPHPVEFYLHGSDLNQMSQDFTYEGWVKLSIDRVARNGENEESWIFQARSVGIPMVLSSTFWDAPSVKSYTHCMVESAEGTFSTKTRKGEMRLTLKLLEQIE